MIYGVKSVCERISEKFASNANESFYFTNNLYGCGDCKPPSGKGGKCESLRGGNGSTVASERRKLFEMDIKERYITVAPPLVIDQHNGRGVKPTSNLFQKCYCWAPAEQFLIKLKCTSTQCKNVETTVNRHCWSREQRVWGMDGECVLIYAIYKCSKCRVQHSSSDMDEMVAYGVPPHVLLQCPVVFYKKLRFTNEFHNWVIQCIENGVSAGTVHHMMLQNITTKYLRDMNIFHSHLEYYLKDCAAPGTMLYLLHHVSM